MPSYDIYKARQRELMDQMIQVWAEALVAETEDFLDAAAAS
jgi:hypothetical protein